MAQMYRTAFTGQACKRVQPGDPLNIVPSHPPHLPD